MKNGQDRGKELDGKQRMYAVRKTNVSSPMSCFTYAPDVMFYVYMITWQCTMGQFESCHVCRWVCNIVK